MKPLQRNILGALLFAGSLSAHGAAPDLTADIGGDYPYLKALYTHLHSNPEISLQEEKTSTRMAEELKSIGYSVTTGVGGYGVVGVLKNGTGPTVLIRTDTDGLPVLEKTGVPHASTVTTVDDNGKTVPVMHACGHDVHMTSFIGTARRLAAMQDTWQGTLVMIAQPAEERVLGAKAMIDDGLFERFPRPDYNIALHVSPALAAGEIGLVAGFSLANVDSVDIAIKGISGHGAYPHTTKDPVVLGAQIVMALQTLVSRETSPLEAAVVTVGSFHAGTKHNIISDSAHLQLTVRSYKDDVRKNLLKGIKRIAHAQGVSLGLPENLLPVVTVGESTPATYNDPTLTKRIHDTLAGVFGKDKVHMQSPVMGAEDFAHYGRVEPKIPSLIFRLGTVSAANITAAEAGTLRLPSLHSSYYAPDLEPSIKAGVTAMTNAVLELLKTNK